MKNILVGQSGGPTAVLNASLYGVIKKFLTLKGSIHRIYGMVNGVEGFLNGKVVDLEMEFPDDVSLEKLKTTPGAYLGSCRYKLPDELDDSTFSTLFHELDALNIRYFLYIGGNDSMDTVSKLSLYASKINSPVRIIGIPKTIDNDLVLTDHTPGFGSAAKYVATTVREIGIDSSIYNTKSVTIVEIMGRHAGWLTAASVLSRQYPGDNPLLIYLPEATFDIENFLTRIEQAFLHSKNLMVCISEGIRDKDGMFICEYDNQVGTDSFGHKMLAGSGKYLENLIRDRFPIKVRSIELNVTQRCSSTLQSLTDVNEAIEAGAFGLERTVAGETAKMVALKRVSDAPYTLTYETVDVNKVCNREKTVPLSWITGNGTDLSDECIAYLKPLIQGNTAIPIEDGLPVYAYRNIESQNESNT